MTTADDARPPGHPVDIDLLADYLAGELDGASARRVETLVDQEPTWAASLAALRRADGAVRDALAGVPAEAMPESVFDRIMAALPAAPASGGTAGSGRATGAPALTGTGPAAGAGSRPAGRADHAGGPAGGPGRRTRRFAGSTAKLVLGAAALVVIGLIGVVALVPALSGTNKSTTTSGAAAPQGVPDTSGKDNHADATSPSELATVPPGAPGRVLVTASGRDYTQANLGNRAPAAPVPAPIYQGTEHATQVDAPPGLVRLTDQAALTACLTLVGAAYGGPPSTVDFAHYQGSAALVVTVPASRTVVAVGPDCGLPGSGTDVLATAPTS